MKATKTTAGLLAALLSAALVLTACGSSSTSNSSNMGNMTGMNMNPSQPAAAADKNLKTVKIGYLMVMDDAQVLLANDAGFFTKHGLKADMQMFASGTDLVKAIVGGQLDAGVLGFTNAVSWAAKGADVKVVGGAQMGYHSMLVKKNSGIKSIADLKGKRVASQKPGSTADVILNGVTFQQAGLTRDDVKMTYVEPAAAIQALSAGQVDAAFVFDPFDHIARASQPVDSIYEVGKVWPFPCMVVIANGKAMSQNKDVMYAMLDAQKDAIDMLQKQPKEAAKLLTPHFIQDPMMQTPSGQVASTDVIADSITSQTFNWDITPDQVQRMQEIIDMMVAQKALDKTVPINSFLDLSWQKTQGK